MKSKTFYKYLFIIWVILLFTLTSIPSLNIPSHKIVGTDKLAHFTFYLIFAFLYVKRSNITKLARTVNKLSLMALSIPLIDELHQIPIQGRNFSIYDILADILGFFVIIVILKIKLLKSTNLVKS